MAPRLVRKAPLKERIQNYLSPSDWWLWANEELNSNDWEDFQKEWGVIIGVAVNLVFMLALANSRSPIASGEDEVFGDIEVRKGSGWLARICSGAVLTLGAISVLNALSTFTRKRRYRLFEQPVDSVPHTPSAQRVRVDSSPVSSSPMRFIANLIAPENAQSRAHPDATRDVWEIAVWDPTPLNMQLFSLFSPGHVIVYSLFLPLDRLDPSPSITVVKTIALGVLLSLQLHMLHTNFSQQIKDSALIHKEVLNEYDIKFVHPTLNKPVRDVGIQTPPPKSRSSEEKPAPRTREVDVYTPSTILKRGFHVNPNPAYAAQYDPDNVSHQPSQRLTRSTAAAAAHTPGGGGGFPRMTSTAVGTSTTTGADYGSPLPRGPGVVPTSRATVGSIRQPQFRDASTGGGGGGGDGGSLGVFTHAASPLRKSTANFSPTKREGSPLKRVSMPLGGGGGGSGGFGTQAGLDDARRHKGLLFDQQHRLARPDSRGESDRRRETGRF